MSGKSLLTYPIFGSLDSSCCAVWSGVQVFSTRCLTIHIQRQHKSSGEYSAHCVVNLRKSEIYFSGQTIYTYKIQTNMSCFGPIFHYLRQISRCSQESYFLLLYRNVSVVMAMCSSILYCSPLTIFCTNCNSLNLCVPCCIYIFVQYII